MGFNSKKKIFVRFGHDKLINGSETGAVGFLNEMDVVEEYANYLVGKLIGEYGNLVEVKTYRQTSRMYPNRDEALMAAIYEANDWGADLYVSCHVNGEVPSANGAEVLVKADCTESKKVAEAVLDAVVGELGGIRDRGLKYPTNKGELIWTDMPTIIIEPFFCTNQNDCDIYEAAGPRKLGESIAAALPKL